MHVMFIKRHVRLLKQFASKEDFATRVEVDAVLTTSLKKTPEGQAAREQLRAWRLQIMQAEPGDHTIFVEFLPELNELAKSMCDKVEEFATWREGYVNDLNHYVKEAGLLLRSVWLSKSNKKLNPELTKFYGRVMARIGVWQCPDKRDDHLPAPLITSCVLDCVFKSLSAIYEGYKEVSTSNMM
jgi:hypothetical protein